jgi:FkbM family methyltransferase
MAHWAELDDNNIVIRVLVGSNEESDEGYGWLINNLGGRWVKTSYNAAVNGFRGMFAGIGTYYDEAADRFRLRYENLIGTVDQFGMTFSYGVGSSVPEDDPDLEAVVGFVTGLALISGSIIDVGAGVGNVSCVLAQEFGRPVVAVEPDEGSAYWIPVNTTANNVSGVSVFRDGLGDYPDVSFSLLFSNNMSDPEGHPMEFAIGEYANRCGVAGSVVVVRSNYGMPEAVQDLYQGWAVEQTVGPFIVFVKEA